MTCCQEGNFGVNVVNGIQNKVWMTSQQLLLSFLCVHCINSFNICFWQNAMEVVLQYIFDALHAAVYVCVHVAMTIAFTMRKRR